MHPRKCSLRPLQALTGIWFVLKIGIPWTDSRNGMGCGQSPTVRRCLQEWQAAVLWEQPHRVLLDRLRNADKLHLSEMAGDNAWVPANFEGNQTGLKSTDLRKKGSKHYILTEANGIQLAVRLTGAFRHRVNQPISLVDVIPAIERPRGRTIQCLKIPTQTAPAVPRCTGFPAESRHRASYRATRTDQQASGVRWVVARKLSWLRQYRRLRGPYKRRTDIHQTLSSTVRCPPICWESPVAED